MCTCTRAVIDIGDIDISIKMRCDINIDIEIVDINIFELGSIPVEDLASLTTNVLKSIYHSKTMCKLIKAGLNLLMCLESLFSLAFRSLQFRSGKHSFIGLLMDNFLRPFSPNC